MSIRFVQSLWRRWLAAPALAVLLLSLGFGTAAADGQVVLASLAATPTAASQFPDPAALMALMAAVLAAGGVLGLTLGLRFQIERARIGALSRSRPDDDPELVTARRNLAALQLERRVQKIIADWPELSEQQQQRIVTLLTAGARNGGDTA